MDLTLNSDQIGLLDAVGKLVAPFRRPPPNAQQTLLTSAALDVELREAGFRDVARFDGMGPLDAVLVAEVVHALPYSVEFAGSALLGPALGIEIASPLALLRAPADGPARYLMAGGVALIVDGDDASLFSVAEEMVDIVETPFAYPIGKLKACEAGDATRLPGAGALARQWWSVALAAELGATAKAAVDLTVDYVKDRRQFGRPLGSYQAVQHRLSECAVAVQGIQTLVRRAAGLGTAEAALTALIYAKESCPQIIYDAHQFQGAIGLTYEYPLHFYTYRLRLLHGELASLADCAEQLALARWDRDDLDWNE